MGIYDSRAAVVNGRLHYLNGLFSVPGAAARLVGARRTQSSVLTGCPEGSLSTKTTNGWFAVARPWATLRSDNNKTGLEAMIQVAPSSILALVHFCREALAVLEAPDHTLSP